MIAGVLDASVSPTGRPRSAIALGKAAKVRSQAYYALQAKMNDLDHPPEEKSRRRKALTDEPAVVAKARAKSRR